MKIIRQIILSKIYGTGSGKVCPDVNVKDYLMSNKLFGTPITDEDRLGTFILGSSHIH